jgi:hypothetical protein
MNAVQVAFQIPEYIAQGLSSGAYERVGGVVREVGSKQVVAWLREANETGEQVFSSFFSPSGISNISSVLNLAISTAGFTIVLKRLGDIERQLESAQGVLKFVDYKIDLSFYANFRAALDLAVNAFAMKNTENRRISAMHAINRFLEAEHQYTQLADKEVNAGSLVAHHYLTTLCLAYVTEARCYLELDEFDTARRRLREGMKIFRPLVKRHITTLLTSNPAAYLHPSLSKHVGLKRLTKVYQWLQPELDPSDILEMQIENLFTFAQNPAEWAESLPQAIRISHLGTVNLKNVFDDFDQPKNNFLGFFSSSDEKKSRLQAVRKGLSRLPVIVDLIEAMIEDENRYTTYMEEIRSIRRLGMSFQEWRQLAPPATAQRNGADLICITVPRGK